MLFPGIPIMNLPAANRTIGTGAGLGRSAFTAFADEASGAALDTVAGISGTGVGAESLLLLRQPPARNTSAKGIATRRTGVSKIVNAWSRIFIPVQDPWMET